MSKFLDAAYLVLEEAGTPMTAAETAAFIVAAGRWARGEAAAPEYVPQNHRREDDQPEDDQPGDIVLRIVEQQRKEREGK